MLAPHHRRIGVATLLAAAAALAFAIAFVARLATMLHEFWLQSDVAATPVLATELAHAPAGASVAVGLSGYEIMLWPDQLTRGLPGHMLLWQLTPLVATALQIALLAWTVSTLRDRAAGALTAMIAACAGVLVLFPELTQGFHGNTYLGVALLDAVLVAGIRRRRRGDAAVAAAAGVFTGVNLASDGLLLYAGVLPFAAAVVAVALLHRRVLRDRLRPAATLGVATLASWAATQAAISRMGIVSTVDAGHLALGHLGFNARLLLRLLLTTESGVFWEQPSAPRVLSAAGALLAAAGIVATCRLVLRALARRRDAPERTAHAVYWTVTTALVVAAFLVTDLPVDVFSIRYVVPVLDAVAALLPLLAPSVRARAAVAAGAAVCVAVNTVALLRIDPAGFTYYRSVGADRLADFLVAHHLAHGYAGYWQSHGVTWNSDFATLSVPVGQGQNCGVRDPHALCPYDLNVISTWYAGDVPGPSYLIRDPTDTAHVPDAPPVAFGTPQATYRVDRFVVYVYPYDLASRFAAAGR